MKRTLPTHSFVYKKSRTEPDLKNVKSVPASPGSKNIGVAKSGKLRAPIPKVR